MDVACRTILGLSLWLLAHQIAQTSRSLTAGLEASRNWRRQILLDPASAIHRYCQSLATQGPAASQCTNTLLWRDEGRWLSPCPDQRRLNATRFAARLAWPRPYQIRLSCRLPGRAETQVLLSGLLIR